MGEFSLTHLLILGVILLIFFGPSRLPGLGKSIGQAIRGFKKGINEIDSETKEVGDAKKELDSQKTSREPGKSEVPKTKSDNKNS